MAAAHATPPAATKHGHVELARWATILLICLMLFIVATPFITVDFDPTGNIKAWTDRLAFIGVMIYLSIQFDETARRSSTNMSRFISDNGLALLAVFVGFATLLLWLFRPGYYLSSHLGWIQGQLSLASAFDFYYGVVISQRIAFAGKEREDTVAHS